MPKVHPRLIVALCTLSFIAFGTSGEVRAQRSAIDTYAITNARIVSVTGPIVERGTVVIRNGLIAAVGANISAPPDARIIDGTGLTVYPGLIDAYTNIALPEAAPAPSPGGGGGGAFLLLQAQARPSPGGPNSTQPAGLQPEVMVEDVIRSSGNEIDASRNIGITTALTAPRSGIWMGQSALINLAGETPQQMIVRSPVAMHVSFTPLRGGYPGSLMGVFAQLRQMMLDAQRYRDSLQIYERNPRGIRRPETDRSLAALVPVIEGRMPVVMLANSEREISRALDLAEEFKLKLLIAGGREAEHVADRLAKQNVPVLLSLNCGVPLSVALTVKLKLGVVSKFNAVLVATDHDHQSGRTALKRAIFERGTVSTNCSLPDTRARSRGNRLRPIAVGWRGSHGLTGNVSGRNDRPGSGGNPGLSRRSQYQSAPDLYPSAGRRSLKRKIRSVRSVSQRCFAKNLSITWYASLDSGSSTSSKNPCHIPSQTCRSDSAPALIKRA